MDCLVQSRTSGKGKTQIEYKLQPVLLTLRAYEQRRSHHLLPFSSELATGFLAVLLLFEPLAFLNSIQGMETK